ncbi:hypothetical protein C7458_108287 [Williamsia muralis]|nr:hypothetical protein C7458_108287 [Williamsia marianensis]
MIAKLLPGRSNLGRSVRSLALLTLFVAGVAGCDVVAKLDTDNPDKAATVLKVSIPGNAGEVVSYTDSSAQGNCTDLSFLLPTSEWESYVAQYFRGPLSEAFVDGYACNESRPPCEDRPGGELPQRVDAEDVIRVDDSSQYRALLVVSECFPGQTLISWKTGAI